MKRILVVEDNHANLYLIRFILEKNGYEVLEARTGIEAMELAPRMTPDLILMDIQLPDINGLECTRRLRLTPQCGGIPIVALTSYAMPGDRERALAAGCAVYIEKPINPETFAAEIEGCFRLSSDPAD